MRSAPVQIFALSCFPFCLFVFVLLKVFVHQVESFVENCVQLRRSFQI